MRNGIAIFLLLVLGCPLVGTRAILLLRKKAIRKEVKARIVAGVGKHELVHFVFSKTDSQTKLRWEHAREFEYRGEMYDIVESEIRGDSTAYWCIWDKAETQLNRQLATLTASATNTDPPYQTAIQQLFDFLKNLFPPAQQQRPVAMTAFIPAGYHYLSMRGRHTSAPPSPPPEALFPLWNTCKSLPII